MRAVTLLCVFPVKFLRLSRDASQVRRGWATDLRLPAREICFVTAASAFTPAPQRLHIVPQNQVCGEKRRTYGFAAADLSGLSLPDAPCEHTDIRGKPKNLTKDFLPPIMDAVQSADRAYRDCPSRQEPPTSPCAVSRKGVCGSDTDCRGRGCRASSPSPYPAPPPYLPRTPHSVRGEHSILSVATHDPSRRPSIRGRRIRRPPDRSPLPLP